MKHSLDDVAQVVKAWLLTKFDLDADIDYEESYSLKAPELKAKVTPVSRYTQMASRSTVIVHYLLRLTIYQSGKANLPNVLTLIQEIEQGASAYTDQATKLVFGLPPRTEANGIYSPEAMEQGNLALGTITLDIQGWEGI